MRDGLLEARIVAMLLAAGVGMAALGCVWARAAVPDMVPMPKSYEQTGGDFELSGKPIFIEKGNRQCEIAADEIARRVKELGGEPGEIKPMGVVTAPGIYVLPVTSAAAVRLAGELALKVTADDPGPQGYVIETARDRLVVVGSDNVGTLYGAMTLRQMMASAGAGRVTIAAARVRDWPDYRYRGHMSFYRGLKEWGGKPEDYKAGIDWLMRFKLNMLSDYGYSTDPRDVDAGTRAFIRRLNEYALERGIYAMRGEDRAYVGCELDKDRPEFQNWDCVFCAHGPQYYCWSRDELTRARAESLMQLQKDCGFSIFLLHPIDGGGIIDPEMWSKRCASCKARFGDDRWKASAHQFNLWVEIMREKGLDLVFTSPIYPYQAGDSRYADRLEPKYAVHRKNSVEYWSKLHAILDPCVIPMTWMTTPDAIPGYRACFEGRPIALYAHSTRVQGYFGTWHRYNGSNYSGNPNDIFLLSGGWLGPKLTWLNNICSGEFCWNTKAPGSAEFGGLYYDSEKDHTEPKEIIEDWLPRACRALFGSEVGTRIAPVYQAGVLPLYIEEPGTGIATANQYRRRAKAGATDPGDTKGGTYIATAITDSAARMARQVAATRAALAALQDAYGYLDTIDAYRRRTFMYFYKRMPLWHLLAKAQHAAKLAAELDRDGKRAAAVRTLEEARRELEKDRAFARRILDATSNEPDLAALDPLPGRAEKIDKMLNLRLKSLNTVFKPRPAGDTLKVAVYGQYGLAGTKKYLQQFRNVEVETIGDLSAATLDPYDCVLLFQTRSLDEADYFHTLASYVKDGGRGVLFQHDLCGFGRYPFGERTPFPEISPYANGRKDLKKVKAAVTHTVLPGLKQGDVQEHMYYDHITPKPGPEGTVVAEDEAGDPVVVIGTAGEGKVIFDGNVSVDHADKSVALTGFNAVLARGAVEWFAGVKLVEK
ncbi:MAG: hypothetical protein JXR37_35310 [Kiritimatiellae bacterium]|nr:hypothetical protein [Kiritimatiellia bacterium]